MGRQAACSRKASQAISCSCGDQARAAGDTEARPQGTWKGRPTGGRELLESKRKKGLSRHAENLAEQLE